MKRICFLLLFINSLCFGQDFSFVDDKVKSYPRFTKVEDLAKKIDTDFTTDFEKVRAAFIWLAENIRYDIDEYYNPKSPIRFRYSTEEERLQKLQEIRNKIVEDAFLSKSGVCEEYAQSFKKLCDLVGIEAQVIKGYTRTSAREIGRVPRDTNHAWNAVKIDDTWILLDATWAAGYIFNGKWEKNYNEYFFAISPKKVGRTHYPDDRKWQLVLNQRSLEDFYNQPIYGQSFLRENLDLENPKNGRLIINNSQPVVLKIKNVKPTDQLYYNFRGQRYSQKPTITTTNNISELTIPNPGRNTELYLFLNRRLALEFKVDVQ